MHREPRRIRTFVTVEEASNHLHIATRTSYRWLAQHRFPVEPIRLNRSWRIPVAELEAYSGQRVDCAYVRPMTMEHAS